MSTHRDGPPAPLTDDQIIEALLEHCDRPAAKGAAAKAVERIRKLRAAIPSPLPSDEELQKIVSRATLAELHALYGHALQTAKEHPDKIDEMIAALKAKS